MFGRAFRDLVLRMAGNAPVVDAVFEPNPGSPTRILKQPATRTRTSSIGPGTCRGGILAVDFVQGSPRDWPAPDGRGGPRVTIRQGGTAVAWDDDPKVELHLQSLTRDPARWRLLWTEARAGATYRVEAAGNQIDVTCS
jgi:hypothetical protein